MPADGSATLSGMGETDGDGEHEKAKGGSFGPPGATGEIDVVPSELSRSRPS